MPGEGLGDLTTVSLVMDGLQHYDWEVSRITFNFWFRLCEQLVQNESSVVKFNIIFETLLQALTRLCQVKMDLFRRRKYFNKVQLILLLIKI